MGSGAGSPGAMRAGKFLDALLAESDGPYRRKWARYAIRQQDGETNYLAIAGVIADYLQTFPEKAADRDVLPGQLMHRVRRALRGELLSRPFLDIFIAAFAITDEAEILHALWLGKGRDRVVIGRLGATESPPQQNHPTYRTKRLYELHEVGSDGLPCRHQTIQTIEALTEDLSSHRFAFDTSEVIVQRIHGGSPGSPFHVGGSIWAVDIKLPRKLARGDEASLQYETLFRYTTPPPPVFRRVIHGRARDVVIRVAFHPDRLPQHVWWAEWEDYHGEADRVLWEQEVTLDSEHASERHLVWFQQAAAGYRWEF